MAETPHHVWMEGSHKECEQMSALLWSAAMEGKILIEAPAPGVQDGVQIWGGGACKCHV